MNKVSRYWTTALYILLAGGISFIALWVRCHLADVPFERDEGEYAYAGQLILQGIPPYREVYNMKFPGVYYMYAIFFRLFGEQEIAIRYGVVLLQIIGAVYLYLLAQAMGYSRVAWVAVASFLLFNIAPFMQGTQTNTEHFVVFFLIISLYLIYTGLQQESLQKFMLAGAFLAIACLMKQHAFIFGAVAVCYAIQKRGWLSSIKYIAAFALGGLVPMLLMGGYLWYAGVWDKFYFLTVLYAREYASLSPMSDAVNTIKHSAHAMVAPFPSPWLGAAVYLCTLSAIVYSLRQHLFLGLLIIAAALAVCPGFYFRPHYFLLTVPASALLLTHLSNTIGNRLSASFAAIPSIAFLSILAAIFISNYYTYYFVWSPDEVNRQLYHICTFTDSRPVAAYIKAHSEPNDRVCMVGSEPQLFFLSQRKGASGYIYVYPLLEPQKFAPQMTEEFIQQSEQAHPKLLVFSNQSVFDNGTNLESRLYHWFLDFKKGYTLKAIYGDKDENCIPHNCSQRIFDTIAPMDTFSILSQQIRVYERNH